MLRAFPERTVSVDAATRFEAAIARRATGEPVAYILGEREFWSLRLKVTSAVLIPRPDTEVLVATALELIPLDASYRIADLGTGSGAIALAIGKERPKCHVTATDVSESALEVARENARNLEIGNVTFCLGDWTQPLHSQKFDVMVSNPPYIAMDDAHLQQGDVRFEPITALTSGVDGLADIARIATEARLCLEPRGWLVLEHGWDQAESVRALLQKNGYQAIDSILDLAGIARVTLGQTIGKSTNR